MAQSAMGGRIIVVDIGKTNAKISLWDEAGQQLARKFRANERRRASDQGYGALDVQGINAWLIDSMREFAADGAVARIVTVGHGAAAALIRNERLYIDPLDYEEDILSADRADYELQRDAFSETGSPSLPLGLNLGAQLYWLEQKYGPFPKDVTIVPWPQYWAWRFSGVAASEVTSLGCHSDLWLPARAKYSELAERRSWSRHLAPLRRAADVLGPITEEIAAATGLNRDCQVLCGIHDSNAALLAARCHPEIADNEATVLSTGTWFVAMRSVGPGDDVDITALEESRDCLVNVDAWGRPVPSARFMGGREAELAGGVDSFRLTDHCNSDELLTCLPALIERDVDIVPGFVPGVGPFPNSTGYWNNKPDNPAELRAATDLYLALVANTALDLIGSSERLLVEGRFAADTVFVRALAALRPDQHIYLSNIEHDVAYGALSLVDPELVSFSELTEVRPLEIDISAFAENWKTRANHAQEAA